MNFYICEGIMKLTLHSTLLPLTTLVSSLVLSACGGSSNSSGSSAKPEPKPEENKAPVFAGIEPLTLDDIESLSFTLQANDAEQDPLTFSLISKPDELGIQVSAAGQVTVTPTRGKGMDGTLVVSVSDGELSANQEIPVSVLKTELFAGIDENGEELWITNGTEEGTRRVKDIYPGAGNSIPMHFTELGELTYFTATHPDYGREIWQTDGTPNGTKLVIDFDQRIINGDNQSMRLNSMVAWQDNIYFSALVPGNTSSAIYRLPTGDETEAQRVAGYSPFLLTPVGDKLYYADYTSAHGTELYVYSDGNSVRLTDISSGATNSLDLGSKLFAVGDTLYFTGNDTSTSGVIGYWRTTGTADSVEKVSFDSERIVSLDPVIAGDRLFYTRTGGITGTSVMQVGINDENPHSDGVFSLNTVKVGQYDVTVLGQYTMANRFVVIARFEPVDQGNDENWIFVSEKTDNGNYSMQGSMLAANIAQISQVTVANNQLYIAGQDSNDSDYKLWSLSVGENGDVSPISEIGNPLASDSTKRDVRFDFKQDKQIYQAGAEGGLLFGGYDETNGWELWITNPDDSSVSLLKDILAGTGNGLGTLVEHNGPCERCEF